MSNTLPIAAAKDSQANRPTGFRGAAILPPLLIFFVVWGVCMFSLARNKQLGFMGGMAEEHLNLGWNLVRTGQFYPGVDDYVYRAPGYPFFIAVVLKIWGRVPPEEEEFIQLGMLLKLSEAAVPVYFAQTLVHALTAVLFFFWVRSRLKARHAACLALVYGCNPYTIVLTGLLDYSTLNLAFIVAGCMLLHRALEKESPRFEMAAAGVVWGVGALVRPTSLLLPAFVFLMAVIRHGMCWRRVVAVTLVFSAAMAVAIAPWMIRNYLLTDRFIPVNAQGSGLYLNFIKKEERAPNHYRWGNKFQFLLPLYLARTGSEFYDYDALIRRNLELNDMAAEFVRDYDWVGKRRDVYVYNLRQNIVSFLLDINSVMIKVYQAIQTPGLIVDKGWFAIGHPQDFHDSRASRIFEYLFYTLTAVGYLGIGLALVRRDRFLLVPFFVYLNFCAVHAITIMDLMYYYVKVPFLAIFGAYMLSVLQDAGWKKRFDGFEVDAADVVCWVLTGATAWLVRVVIFAGPRGG